MFVSGGDFSELMWWSYVEKLLKAFDVVDR